MRKPAYFGLLLLAIVAACSHSGNSGLPPGAGSPALLTPQSVSPGLIKPGPMVHTQILPASAMKSPIHPNIPVSSLNWTQVPGTATVVAASPDGTLWVLSDQPAGPDKYIWHYANGAWTNISGMASQISPSQDGSLWVINSAGGIYQYASGTWTPLGGGASNSISTDASGGIYVLSNGGAGADKAIWHYSSGTGWVQQAGSGTALAANFDTNSHTPGSGGSGVINPGGFYILNSVGGIYYENSDRSFAQLPGGASGIAPTTNGGVFVLGYPASQSGNQIYYYDLDNPGYTNESGSGLLSISANTSLYTVSPSNAIYTAPLPSAVPAYCSAYSTPVPNANSSPQPVWITDNSNTGAHVVLYVVTGATGSGQTQYLAANGTLQNFAVGATAAPFPLECFPGSTHEGSGLTFELPPPTIANTSGNLYIAYATPPPGGGVANPLVFKGAGTVGGYQGPTFDWNTPTYVSTPYDYVEYTLPYGITDVTQVDKVGLPLQLTQGNTTIGFASGQYENLLSAILADPIYSKLAVSAQLNGRNVLARILGPQQAGNWGFPQDWWYNSAFNSGHSALGKGYLGYVLSQYQSAPQLYTLNGIPGLSGNYCATFDGSSNVLFYSVGSSSSCSGLSGTPISMGIAQTLEGSNQGVDSYGVCHSSIFGMPYGGPGGPIPPAPEAFYLWKAMVIDIARGVALQNGPHPVGGWDTSPTVPVPLSSFYLDPAYNTYSYLVHKYMIGNRSYALPYDEPGGLAPTFTSEPSQTLKITIWNIPSYSRANPTVNATPRPCPT